VLQLVVLSMFAKYKGALTRFIDYLRASDSYPRYSLLQPYLEMNVGHSDLPPLFYYQKTCLHFVGIDVDG
jgi:hypothetical protein